MHRIEHMSIVHSRLVSCVDIPVVGVVVDDWNFEVGVALAVLLHVDHSRKCLDTGTAQKGAIVSRLARLWSDPVGFGKAVQRLAVYAW
jgi:hypothetical protein